MELNPVYVIEFDLMCNKTKLDIHPKPRYRIYVDDDLMAERDYVWDNATEFVRERCEVRLEKGEHKVKIEDLDSKGTAIYSFANTTVDKQPLAIDNAGKFEIS